MIAQELIGRPYITLFGIKLTSVVWILIAIVLGFIFSMVAWPGWWRALYKRIREKKKNGV